jgi:predicted DNA-binding WGR domain protein
MPRFEFVKDTSNKYWEITQRGSSLTIKFGKIGTAGQQQYKVLKSEEEAKREYERLISEKLRKGYVKVSDEISNATGSDASEANGVMTKQEFWALIDQSRRATEDIEEQIDRLRNLLGQLTADEILAFDRHFQEALQAAYRWELWAAAYIINGGCSDDGFDYFLGWLIAQGQRYFEASLADPNNAGTKVEPGDYVECEEIWYVAAEAYETLTGKSDFHERAVPVPRELQGNESDEAHVNELFPKLARKFAP